MIILANVVWGTSVSAVMRSQMTARNENIKSQKKKNQLACDLIVNPLFSFFSHYSSLVICLARLTYLKDIVNDIVILGRIMSN